MTLVMTWFTNVKRGGEAGGRFLVPQHETAGLTPIFTAPDPDPSLPAATHFQTTIKKPAGKGGFFKRQG